MRKTLTCIFFFAIVAVCYAYSDARYAADIEQAQESQTARSKVIAYYFHGTRRCSTCLRMEEYSRGAIESFFAKELKEGVLEFKPVNTDDSENRHFIQDFQLFTRSLVLARYDNGELKEYKNLPDIWTYSGDKMKFCLYVKNEVERFFKEKQ